MVVFFAPALFAQVIAYEKAGADTLLYKAHDYSFARQYERAFEYFEKAAKQYESQSNPKEAEANCFAGLVGSSLNRGEASEGYFKKNKKFENGDKKTQKWAVYYAYLSKLNLYKKYQLKDSADVCAQKILALSETNTGAEREIQLRVLAFIQLCKYYLNSQRYDIAYDFAQKAYETNQTQAEKNSPLGLEAQFNWFYLNLAYQKDIDKYGILNQNLAKVVDRNNIRCNNAVNLSYKIKFLYLNLKSDLAGIMQWKPEYEAWIKKNYGEQSAEMGTMYMDYGVGVGIKVGNRSETLLWLKKGLAVFKNVKDPNHKKNILITYRNIINTHTDRNETPDDIVQGRIYAWEGLAKAVNNGEQKLNYTNLPNFADLNVRCDDIEMATQIAQTLYHNYFREYADVFSKAQQDTLRRLLDLHTSLTQRLVETHSGELGIDNIMYEYRVNQFEHIKLYRYAYKLNPKLAYVDSLLKYAENTKSLETAQQLDKNKRFALAGLSSEDISKYKEVETMLQKLNVQVTVWRREGRKAEADKAFAEYLDYKNKAAELDKIFNKKYPLYQSFNYQKKGVNLAEIQKQLNPRAVCLYFTDNNDSEFAMVFRSDTAWVVDSLFGFGKKEYRYADLQKMIYQKGEEEVSPKIQIAEFSDAYRYWYKKLIDGTRVLADEKTEELIVVPASQTSLIPFELLMSTDKKDAVSFAELPYLLKKVSVQYLNSATIWIENKQRAAQSSQNGKILAFAPTYQRGLKNEARSKEQKLLRANFSELDGAKAELANFKTYYRGDYYEGEAANEAALKSKINQSYSILHLAMHGVWDGENSNLSNLVFSESADTTEDNFLNAYEIAQLQQHSQLVVLSACETAKGEVKSGEGIMSIARYFMYGGVPSVVATRWQVNDQATAFIMQNFYKYIYEGKTTKAAIRAAQLDYLAQARGVATHPFYWAAFINIGNTDTSVYLAHKNWATRYYVIGILGLCGAAVCAWRYSGSRGRV